MKELIFGLLGGTALLMYGVDKMGEGLEKASGEMMKKILTVLTGRVWSAFLVGTLLTALVQSSTAITVLTVGFVNAGLMKLPQAIGIIYGANIGTTITAQLMAFSYQFKLTDVALPILAFGFMLNYFAKNKSLKNIGDAIMGFGIMFLGLKILNSGIPFMQQSETLRYFFENYASNPVIAIVLGAVATAMVHSSAATVGLVMVLGQAGLIDLQSSICIMLGDNIGTCITAQLASMAGNIYARRTAWAHTLYNIFGVVLVALILPLFVKIVESTTVYLQPASDISAQIANSHTIFNVLSALLFLPITKHYVRFLELVIRGKGKDDEDAPRYLNKLLLNTPLAAFKASLAEMVWGAEITKGMVGNLMEALYSKDQKKLDSVRRSEEKINRLQKDIISYIVDISKEPLSDSESAMIPAMVSAINNIERIGDHAMDILGLTRNMIEKNLAFSNEAMDEIKELQGVVSEMFDNTILMLKENDINYAFKTAELESTVDRICKELLDNHLCRLEDGRCTVEAGVIYSDIINYFERIADHIYKVCTLASEKFQTISR
ncbi:Na+/Pi-cotransporter [Oxobacter pfennigii]|uniref:Na+/Pi-cotransporter n=1 Tax=Oxobacter pfennigii TaxID=36849 RepID=A0A0P8Z255_9CLOT|nr:Na/Pi cotransporter family protein [Oxobacter pfennigii]KPU46227.1 Na+/Pi-cotransporter [Oxobacter pfennigii]